MQNNRLGCLSFSSLITALVVLVVIAGTALARGNGMFSPGALNAVQGSSLGGVTSHAATGGDCGACHVAPWSEQGMADRCEDCHTGIVSDMSKVARAHGEMLHNDSNLDCAHCHPEHRGSSAPLTLEVAMSEFPHAVMGYSLNGHALTAANEPFVCKDCHAQSLTGFDSSTCIECHSSLEQAFTSRHVQSWGEECLACHDGVDTYNKHFDHGRVPFVLTGAHVKVDCYDCHASARNWQTSSPRPVTAWDATRRTNRMRVASEETARNVTWWMPGHRPLLTITWRSSNSTAVTWRSHARIVIPPGRPPKHQRTASPVIPRTINTPGRSVHNAMHVTRPQPGTILPFDHDRFQFPADRETHRAGLCTVP